VIRIPYAAWTCAIQGAMIPYAQVEPEPSISAYSGEVVALVDAIFSVKT